MLDISRPPYPDRRFLTSPRGGYACLSLILGNDGDSAFIEPFIEPFIEHFLVSTREWMVGLIPPSILRTCKSNRVEICFIKVLTRISDFSEPQQSKLKVSSEPNAPLLLTTQTLHGSLCCSINSTAFPF